MRKLLIALLATFVLTVPSPASADLITYQFSGTVSVTDAILPIYMPGIQVGTVIYGNITYDPNHWPQAYCCSPYYDPSYYNLYVGDFHFYGPVEQQYIDPHSFLWHFPQLDGPLAHSWNGADWLELHFNEPDPTTGAGSMYFYGLDLARCPPLTSEPGCDDTPGFGATFNSVVQAPDPGSTALLFGLGMTGLLGCRHAARRRLSWRFQKKNR